MSRVPAMQDEVDHIMDVMAAAFDPIYGEAWNRRQVIDALTLGNCSSCVLGWNGRRIGNGSTADGERAAGFYMSRHAFDEEELLLIAVSPEARRRGIGRRLLELFEEGARSRGATRLILEMRDGNPAEALYVAAGFQPIGRRAKYYRGPDGTRIDAITFARPVERGYE